MKKALKIGCLYPFLALLGISILIGIVEEIFDVEILPEETHDTVETISPSQKIRTLPQENTASMTSDETVEMRKVMVWDQTPEAQGVVVGDWIYIRGYPVGFIGASLTDGVLEWNDTSVSRDMTFFALVSTPNGLSVAEDRIVNMLGFIKISPQTKNITSINYLYFNQGESPLIWVVAKITQIDPPDPSNRYPGQWGINLTDIQVGLVSE